MPIILSKILSATREIDLTSGISPELIFNYPVLTFLTTSKMVFAFINRI
jgi:hypothetical protein